MLVTQQSLGIKDCNSYVIIPVPGLIITKKLRFVYVVFLNFRLYDIQFFKMIRFPTLFFIVADIGSSFVQY